MANNTYYNIYRDNTIELVRSLIYKSNITAYRLNLSALDLGYEVINDKRTWRYYLHLAGEYHFLDDQMEIISLDTNEKIIFNKENLKQHKRTRNLYKTNTSYVIDLIHKYPEQSNLVRGILHPVDMDTAINADDGTVFYHDPKYIEPQESYLIEDIEGIIKAALYRVNMDTYVVSEELTAATIIAIIDAKLITGILSARDKKVKTAYAHSYHVANYLASYNRLDEFIDYLTLEQRLFLYINIDNIVRHTGMQRNFDILVEKLLTLRNLPTFDYDIRHLIIDAANGKLQPEPVFVKNKLNLDSGINVRDLDIHKFEDITYKEIPLAKNNRDMYWFYGADSRTRAERAKISDMPTKIVEVSAVDPEDVETVKFLEVLMSEWIYHTTVGNYVATTTLLNPLNGDVIKMDARDTLMIFWYAYCKGTHDINQTDIIPLHAFNVAKWKWISEEEYRSVCQNDPFNVLDDDIDFFINSNLVLDDEMRIPSELYERCSMLTTNARTRNQFVNCGQDIEMKTDREALYNFSYFDVWCDLNNNRYKSYQDLLSAYGLEYTKFDNVMWQDLAAQIIEKATSIGNTNTISLRDIQANMVRIIERLSSYTIQFIEEIISTDVSTVANTILLPGDTVQSAESAIVVHLPPLEVTGMTQHASVDIDIDLPLLEVMSVDMVVDRSIEVEIENDVAATVSAAVKHTVVMDNITVGEFNVK